MTGQSIAAGFALPALLLSLAAPDPTQAGELLSPRLAALEDALDEYPDAQVIESFWANVEHVGAPLIEVDGRDSRKMVVTFLWRRDFRLPDVEIAVFGVFNEHPWRRGDRLALLPGTDVWFRSYEMDTALRAPYAMAAPADLPHGQPVEQSWPSEGAMTDLLLDPWNARSVPDVFFGEGARMNYFEGPDAPQEYWLGPVPETRRGMTVARTIESGILGNAREVFVYVPSTIRSNEDDLPFVLLLDGASYLRTAKVPAMLDKMIAAGRIPPIAAVMVDKIDPAVRQEELEPNPDFHRFIAEELVPRLRREFGLTSDPLKSIVGGASRGGLAAGHIAYLHPEIFGNVIVQSGAYWWHPQLRELDGDDPRPEWGWLSRKIAGLDPGRLRFYIASGTLETDAIRETNQELHDLLSDRGFRVLHETYKGGHTFLNWRANLPRALSVLLNDEWEKASVDVRIENVTVVDPAGGRVRAGRDVLVDQRRIVDVVPTGTSGAVADVIVPGTGKFIVPGFVDMHVHMRELETRSYTPSLLLANGVTGVRDMRGDCWDPRQAGDVCAEDMRLLADHLFAGAVVGPRLLTFASQPVNGPISRSALPAGAEDYYYPGSDAEGRKLARYISGRGVDLLKTYKTIPPSAYKALADEAADLGLEISGHIPRCVDVVTAVRHGHRTIEHARTLLYACSTYGPAYRSRMRSVSEGEPGAIPPSDETRLHRTMAGFDRELCRQVLATVSEQGAYYVPTHKTREMDARAGDSTYRNDTNLRYLTPTVARRWSPDLESTASAPDELKRLYAEFFDLGLRVTAMALDAGVRLMVGTDANDTMVIPGFSYHDELAFYEQAGLSPWEALRAASVTPWEYFRGRAEPGGVSPGAIADLVLLDEDPLEDVSHSGSIRAVIANGRVYDRQKLDQLLVDVSCAR